MIVDRRRFLQVAGAVAATAAWDPAGYGETGRFAYVVGGEGRVHVFSGEGGEWERRQTAFSTGAAGLAVRPGGRFVYVGNGVDTFGDLPSGSVETFAVDGWGRLASQGRRGLALFANSPERLAVSPDGSWLAVGLRGGAYNLLPLGEDGLPGRVVATLRKIGATGVAGELAFAGEDLLVSGEGEGMTALAVGKDGALAFVDRPAGGVKQVRVEAGLARAMALYGLGAGAAVAFS